MVARTNKRKNANPEERRTAILDAALTVFAVKSFAAARMEDIAREAGIAKGTVYLYFSDKESLFKSLITEMAAPVLAHAETIMTHPEVSPRQVLEKTYDVIENSILATEKRHILRLVTSEMGNFPEIAEYYYTNIISPGLTLLKALLQKARDREELRSDLILDVPQALFAPVIMAVIWDRLFARFEPLNIRAAFDFYLDSVFKTAGGEAS